MSVIKSLALGLLALGRPVEETPAPVTPASEGLSYMRAAEEPGRTMALEVAARRFVREGGPAVSLVGVAHIGERAMYDRIQDLLDEHDVVLYESVKPAGAGGAGGESDAERVESTVAAMRFLAAVLAAHRDVAGGYPRDLDELAAFAAGRDPRLGGWVKDAGRDAWGRPLDYAGEDAGFALTSLGADGRPGGEGVAADLAVTGETDVSAVLGSGAEDHLQAELARALGLVFQLDALDYGRTHFRCSDMAIDQVQRAFRAEGMAFEPIEGSLAGTSLPGRLVVLLLKIMRLVDIWFDGAIADSFKVVLIELFSDEAFIEQSIRMYGAGFRSVLIEQRNQVVVEDLRAIVEGEPEVESVAILYGAAHMPDLSRRLADQLGYRPAGERWITAFEVDVAGSALAPEDLRRIRELVRRQMRMMK